MKQTILTTKQNELLESLIASFGQIVTSEQIYDKAEASFIHDLPLNETRP